MTGWLGWDWHRSIKPKTIAEAIIRNPDRTWRVSTTTGLHRGQLSFGWSHQFYRLQLSEASSLEFFSSMKDVWPWLLENCKLFSETIRTNPACGFWYFDKIWREIIAQFSKLNIDRPQKLLRKLLKFVSSLFLRSDKLVFCRVRLSNYILFFHLLTRVFPV